MATMQHTTKLFESIGRFNLLSLGWHGGNITYETGYVQYNNSYDSDQYSPFKLGRKSNDAEFYTVFGQDHTLDRSGTWASRIYRP